MVADDLRAEGFDVDLPPPRQVRRLDGDDAVIVGGALYAFRWHKASRRFVRRHAAEIRRRPAYFFSSGPLDDSASRTDIPPVKGVQALMEKTGVRANWPASRSPSPRPEAESDHRCRYGTYS